MKDIELEIEVLTRQEKGVRSQDVSIFTNMAANDGSIATGGLKIQIKFK